jgi:hypothetical protein
MQILSIIFLLKFVKSVDADVYKALKKRECYSGDEVFELVGMIWRREIAECV